MVMCQVRSSPVDVGQRAPTSQLQAAATSAGSSYGAVIPRAVAVTIGRSAVASVTVLIEKILDYFYISAYK